MSGWASRGIHTGLAECPGCIAEQGIQHTCGLLHDVCGLPRTHLSAILPTDSRLVTTSRPVNRWHSTDHSTGQLMCTYARELPTHQLCCHECRQPTGRFAPVPPSTPHRTCFIEHKQQPCHTCVTKTHVDHCVQNRACSPLLGHDTLITSECHSGSLPTKRLLPSVCRPVELPALNKTPSATTHSVPTSTVHSCTTTTETTTTTVTSTQQKKDLLLELEPLTSPTSPNCVTPSSPPIIRQDKRRSLSGTDADLETVKSSTPLYGQPSWWGQWYLDDSTQTTAQHQQSESHTQLECPTDRVESRSVVGQPPNWASSRHTSGGSSMDRDSLQEESPNRIVPAERDTDDSATPNTSGMAFTVDFGSSDGTPDVTSPKLSMHDSLSKFLPHKVRRSFHERSARISDGTDDSDDAKMSSVEKKSPPLEAFSPRSARKQTSPATVRRQSNYSPSTVRKQSITSPGTTRKQAPSPSTVRRQTNSSPASQRRHSNNWRAQGRTDSQGEGHKVAAPLSDGETGKVTSSLKRNTPSVAPIRGASTIQSRSYITTPTPSTKRPHDNPQPQSANHSGSPLMNSDVVKLAERVQSEHANGMDSLERNGLAQLDEAEQSLYLVGQMLCKTSRAILEQSASAHQLCGEWSKVSHMDETDDTVSETGTYTIDEDMDGKETGQDETTAARSEIDEIFGLSRDDDDADFLQLERQCSTPVEIGKVAQKSKTTDAQETKTPDAQTKRGVDEWISQWADSVLCNGKMENSGSIENTNDNRSKSNDASMDRMTRSVEKDVSLKQRVSGGGRRLPATPPKEPSHGVSTDHRSEEHTNHNGSVNSRMLDSSSRMPVDPNLRQIATVCFDGDRGEMFTLSYDVPSAHSHPTPVTPHPPVPSRPVPCRDSPTPRPPIACTDSPTLSRRIMSSSDSESPRSSAMKDSQKSSGREVTIGTSNKRRRPITPVITARPNRTFALRKAKVAAESERPASADSVRRPASAAADPIARRSADSPAGGGGTFVRRDGGRHSMRVTKTTSTVTPVTAPSTSKTRTRQSADGVAVATPRSAPPSRSNSPRSAEYSAWRRRKEYDPRKSARAGLPGIGNSGGEDSGGEGVNTHHPHTQQASRHLKHDDEQVSEQIAHLSSAIAHDLSVMATTKNKNKKTSSRSSSGHRHSSMTSPLPRQHSRIKDEVDHSSLISSIYRLSHKVKVHSEQVLTRLRDSQEGCGSCQTDDSTYKEPETPSKYELGAVLRNLTRTEQQLKELERSLFVSHANNSADSQHYLVELERISHDIAEFQALDRTANHSGRSHKTL